VKRRDFFRYGAAFGAVQAAGAELAFAEAGAGQSAALEPAVGRGDLALVNARVITLDARQPRAEAVLVRNGRIALVGSTADVRAAAGPARVLDAGGRTAVPGFVDAHCHMEVATSAASYMVSVHTPPYRSLSEIMDALGKKAAATPKGEWVVARGSFNLENGVSEKRLLTRQDLDTVTTDHPVIVFSGRHVAMLNTLALKTFHVWDADTMLEAGTIVHRDGSGVPTGLATEVYYHLPAYSVEQIKTAIKAHVGSMFVSKGTTSIYSIPFSANDVRANLELQRAGELPLRVRNYYHVPHTITFDGLMGSGLVSGVGNDMWRFGGMKLFIDGLGGDGLGKRLPDLKWTQEELNHMVSRATEVGMQVIMHVITDEAVEMGVAAVAHARARHTRPVLHRLEHGADDGPLDRIRRMRDLGIRVSITPNRGRPGAGGKRYRTLVGEKFPPVVITDTTGTTPGSSDVMVKIACIATSVDDRGGAGKGEALSFEDALRLFTIENSRVGYEDADKGSIETGKLGDVVLLSRDPLSGTPAQLFDTKVDATVLGGTVVFER
jgi:predicted amidohydrolase YtcJ